MTFINNELPLDWLLSEILEHSPDAFAVFDKDEILVFCNTKFADVFALTTDQALGMAHADLLRHAYHNDSNINIETQDIEAWIADVNTHHRSEKHRVFESDGKDGSWVLISELIINDGYLVVWSNDITELKQTQLKLAEALEKIQRIAAIDELTQVYNRRTFNQLANVELKKSLRHKHSAVMLLMDIDHFKQVNDNYGHANGDLVLQAFAGLFTRSLRQSDIFARYGGEEFAALLPETELEDALALAERLTKMLASQSIDLIDYESVRVTVSTGLCRYEGSDDSLDKMLIRADAALYVSKQQGRNRCTLYTPDMK